MTTITIGDWTFDHASYDERADILYLSIGPPREGTGEDTPEGHILRFDEAGEFYGVTLIGIGYSLDEGEPINITLPRRERVETADLEPVLVG